MNLFFCLFQELRSQCQKFATALLDHTRSSSELEILLNHDPTGPVFQHGERMHLNRLKLAIKYRQKKVRKSSNNFCPKMAKALIIHDGRLFGLNIILVSD